MVDRSSSVGRKKMVGWMESGSKGRMINWMGSGCKGRTRITR
jgi:hypothetical protein